MELRVGGVSKKEFITKLLVYSSLYGLLHVNYIDLVVPGSSIAGYHLWLIIQYFTPFVPLLFIFGLKDWELVLSMGLLASLYNDLFYYPIGILLLNEEVDLLDWYRFQFGLKGFEVKWFFNGGFFTIPVSSILMGLSIYARIIAVAYLCYKWWIEE